MIDQISPTNINTMATKIEYISNCCSAAMPPNESDYCPACGEHCEVVLADNGPDEDGIDWEAEAAWADQPTLYDP